MLAVAKRSVSQSAPSLEIVPEQKELSKTLLIKDCLYGLITITNPIIIKIINTKQFQRLRYLKQTGFLDQVFPGANHTRFEHSIGTYHVACKILESLEKKGHVFSKPLPLLVQVSSLCHDLGHGPFSHFSDVLYPNHKHEEESVKILREINDEYNLFSNAEINIIKQMIVKRYDDRRAAYNIVSGTLDADRIDYLARDAHYTGMPKFEADYIIESFTVNVLGELVLLPKAKSVVASILNMRQYMYDNVYHHHTVQDIEAFIKKTIIDREIEVKTTDTDMDLMLKFMKTPEYDTFVKRQWPKTERSELEYVKLQ